ncbi:methyl-accepting chemotaxis protein [Hydrogenophaga defluvii]|uniref:Methyl-accepting chemotaxis protein n=1 Tax=Hydrogenophaga defluvii TaxID=249410 RepID=A0ABW2SFE4_9BURK
MQTKTPLSVAARLTIAFGLVIALLCGSAVLAILRMAQINHASTEVTTNWLPSSIVTSALNTHTSDFRIAEFQHVLSTDDSDMQAAEADMKALLVTIERKSKEYDQLISSDAERAIWQRFETAWSNYLAVNRRLIELSRTNRNDQARTLLRGESQKMFDEGSNRLLELVDLNTKGGQDASAYADQVYASSRIALIVASAIAVVLAVVAAALFSRWLSRQLGGEPHYAVAVASQIADGKLAMDVLTRAGDNQSILAAMARMREQLAGVVGQVRQNAESVASASAQIATGNQDLSGRTEEQASALEETAASMEELSTTVKQNADNASQANQLAVSASSVAVKGGAEVQEVVATMRSINEASRRIADIIGVIDGIAFQTNILALNAAVEAARAGEQGRGFAVVASEVRNLAQRSANAAKEIKELISASTQRVDQGTTLVDQAGHTIQEVVDAIRRVTDIMGEITAASAEQSAGVSQIGEAVTQMDQATQQNAALVEESAAAADGLRQQAAQLLQVVSVFQLPAGGVARVAPVAQAAPRAAPVAPVVRAPVSKPVAQRKVAARSAEPKLPAMALATAGAAGGGDGDWTSF